MKYLAVVVIASMVVALMGFLPTGAAAQGLLTYHVILEQPAAWPAADGRCG